MSRDYRDKPGGHDDKYYVQIPRDVLNKMNKQRRRAQRREAQRYLRAGEQPPPNTVHDHPYFD